MSWSADNIPSKLALFRSFDANSADLSHTDDMACRAGQQTPPITNIATCETHTCQQQTHNVVHTYICTKLKVVYSPTNTQQSHTYRHTHTINTSLHTSQPAPASSRQDESQAHTLHTVPERESLTINEHVPNCPLNDGHYTRMCTDHVQVTRVHTSIFVALSRVRGTYSSGNSSPFSSARERRSK